jgi:hypothetical protein
MTAKDEGRESSGTLLGYLISQTSGEFFLGIVLNCWF